MQTVCIGTGQTRTITNYRPRRAPYGKMMVVYSPRFRPFAWRARPTHRAGHRLQQRLSAWTTWTWWRCGRALQFRKRFTGGGTRQSNVNGGGENRETHGNRSGESVTRDVCSVDWSCTRPAAGTDVGDPRLVADRYRGGRLRTTNVYNTIKHGNYWRFAQVRPHKLARRTIIIVPWQLVSEAIGGRTGGRTVKWWTGPPTVGCTARYRRDAIAESDGARAIRQLCTIILYHEPFRYVNSCLYGRTVRDSKAW